MWVVKKEKRYQAWNFKSLPRNVLRFSLSKKFYAPFFCSVKSNLKKTEVRSYRIEISNIKTFHWHTFTKKNIVGVRNGHVKASQWT